MKLFNELIGDQLMGVETSEMSDNCNALLLHLQLNQEKNLTTHNNNLDLANTLNLSQIEVKQAKKILENNGLIEILKNDTLTSNLVLTTKGVFYASNLKTQQLKQAMSGPCDNHFPSDTFVDPSMDSKFVEVYNARTYHERVVYEAVVAAIFCRETNEYCSFRTLASLLDATANQIMPILEELEAVGFVALVGEKSTKIYLTNTRDFLMTHYSEFYATGIVQNDFIYKTAFRFDPYSGYAEPYEFPNFEVISNDLVSLDEFEEPITPVMEDTTTVTETVVDTPSASPVTPEEPARIFIIDTESVQLEQFVLAASSVLTANDHYIAMLSAAHMNGSLSFTLFNHLMKLPCRGETEFVELPALYSQFFTIQVLHAIQTHPTSEIVILTNDVSYLSVIQHLKAKFHLSENQLQVMNYSA